MSLCFSACTGWRGEPSKMWICTIFNFTSATRKIYFQIQLHFYHLRGSSLQKYWNMCLMEATFSEYRCHFRYNGKFLSQRDQWKDFFLIKRSSKVFCIQSWGHWCPLVGNWDCTLKITGKWIGIWEWSGINWDCQQWAWDCRKRVNWGLEFDLKYPD